MTGPDGQWLVFLDRPCPKDSRMRRVYNASAYKDRGDTPELAYLDLLGKTAVRLSVLYGFTTVPDVSRGMLSSQVLEELAEVLFFADKCFGKPRTSLIVPSWLIRSAKED
jgi:hypothetical protein